MEKYNQFRRFTDFSGYFGCCGPVSGLVSLIGAGCGLFLFLRLCGLSFSLSGYQGKRSSICRVPFVLAAFLLLSGVVILRAYDRSIYTNLSVLRAIYTRFCPVYRVRAIKIGAPLQPGGAGLFFPSLHSGKIFGEIFLRNFSGKFFPRVFPPEFLVGFSLNFFPRIFLQFVNFGSGVLLIVEEVWQERLRAEGRPV